MTNLQVAVFVGVTVLGGCGRVGFDYFTEEKCTGDVCLPTCPPGVSPSYGALGAGTRDNPYLLCTAAQLLDLMNAVDPSAWTLAYGLGADIDLSGYDQTSNPVASPIGTSTAPFSGSFDGNGHVISNFTLNLPTQDEVGLFGVVSGSAAVVRRVKVDAATISGHDYVGILAAWLDRAAVVSGCSSSGVVTAHANAGGLVGTVGGPWVDSSFPAMVSTSSSSADVHIGFSGVGGLVGLLVAGSILRSSYATGRVSADTNSAGGLVGAQSVGLVVDSYATGAVSGNDIIGGLVGNAGGSVVNSFATGSVQARATGTSMIGALVGNGSAVTSSFSVAGTCAVTGGACHGPLVGEGVATNAAQFQDPAQAPLASWDFSSTWTAATGSFPSLSPSFADDVAFGDCTTHQSDAPYAGGSGTLENPYLICAVAQLDALAADSAEWPHWRAYRLMADLDLTGFNVQHFPIGTDARPFDGFFDGNGHTIANFGYTTGGTPLGVGFFGSIAGVVRRLSLKDVSVVASGGIDVAGLAGETDPAGFVVDVYTTGTVSGQNEVAGLVGRANGGIASCYTTAAVHASVGGSGLVHFSAGALRDVFAASAVTVGSGGPLVAAAGQPSVNVYYDSSQPCTGCTTWTGVGETAASYFYDRANLPMSQWNFDTIWQNNPGVGFPTLR
jgi:hypothetical protein